MCIYLPPAVNFLSIALFEGSVWGIGIVLILCIALFVWFSFSVSLGFYVRTFCRKHTEQKLLALTFDDGPHPTYTPQVLDVLKRYGVKATFFVIGGCIAGNEGVLRRIHEEGHQVGNHSFSHKNTFPLLGKVSMMADMHRCESVITAVTGQRPRWFRPPFGVTNPNVAKAVKILNYRVAGWSIRSLDTVISDKDRVVKRVVLRLRPGRIILLHDHLPNTPYIMEELIRQAVEKGYRFATIDELTA